MSIQQPKGLSDQELADRLRTFSAARDSVPGVTFSPEPHYEPAVRPSPFLAQANQPRVSVSLDETRPSIAAGFSRAQSAFQEDQRRRSVRYRERPEQVFTARDEANLYRIPKSFAAKEGTRLNEDLVVGKHLSSGLQGGVWRLNDNAGHEVDLVMKIVHRHALLAEVEREWEVGLRLGFLAEEDGSLPGFMGTGAGLCDESGKFRGMLLERLNGRVVEKVIMAQDFADVHYVRALLLAVFTALGKAQSWLGFHHSDLRLANVMELLPEGSGEEDSPVSDSHTDRRQVQPTAEQATGAEYAQQAAAQANGHAVNGALSDPGSASSTADCVYRFKIIDYGLANFEETYACGPDLELAQNSPKHRPKTGQVERSDASFPGGQPGCRITIPILLHRDDVQQLPAISPVERLYRYMWRRKGDVYHLLFNLGEWLDGRVWPRADQLEVLRLLDLIHHVTGQRLRAWFKNKGDPPHAGWSDKALRPLTRSGKPLHFIRRWTLRLNAWTHPSNPGLTAAEALTAPFFTGHKSLRTVVTGASTRYSTWTAPQKATRRTGERFPKPPGR